MLYSILIYAKIFFVMQNSDCNGWCFILWVTYEMVYKKINFLKKNNILPLQQHNELPLIYLSNMYEQLYRYLCDKEQQQLPTLSVCSANLAWSRIVLETDKTKKKNHLIIGQRYQVCFLFLHFYFATLQQTKL